MSWLNQGQQQQQPSNSFGVGGGTDAPVATGRDELNPADCGRDKKTGKGSLCFPDGLLCEQSRIFFKFLFKWNFAVLSQEYLRLTHLNIWNMARSVLMSSWVKSIQDELAQYSRRVSHRWQRGRLWIGRSRVRTPLVPKMRICQYIRRIASYIHGWRPWLNGKYIRAFIPMYAHWGT